MNRAVASTYFDSEDESDTCSWKLQNDAKRAILLCGSKIGTSCRCLMHNSGSVDIARNRPQEWIFRRCFCRYIFTLPRSKGISHISCCNAWLSIDHLFLGQSKHDSSRFAHWASRILRKCTPHKPNERTAENYITKRVCRIAERLLGYILPCI